MQQLDSELEKNKRIHGSDEFPLDAYVINCDGNENVFDCHFHEEVEFLLVIDGKILFQSGTVYYEIQKDEAVFINSGELHAAYPIEGRPCIFFAVVFKPDILYQKDNDTLKRKYFLPIWNKKYQPPLPISKTEDWGKRIIFCLFDVMHLCITKPDYYELMAKAYLFNVFYHMIKHSKPAIWGKSMSSNTKMYSLKKVLTYIQNNYHRKIEISILADIAGMSKSNFYRFFKKMTRKTPIDFINQYRINKALRFFPDPKNKIADIALYTGFKHGSYFINIFKRYIGCTPSEYRKFH